MNITIEDMPGEGDHWPSGRVTVKTELEADVPFELWFTAYDDGSFGMMYDTAWLLIHL